MLWLTGSVNVEHGRPPRFQALDKSLNQMIGAGNGTLHDIGRTVRHTNQAHLLANLLFTLDRFAVLRHVRNMTEES